MAEQNKTILVTGATGKQGGAVARHLLRSDWQVRALTRDPGKPEAHELKSLGAQIVSGDMNDPDSLARALDGCYGVFSVQNTWTSGVEGELREGKNMADAAQAAGIKHFVYTSVGGADLHTGIPHFESKWQLEEYIRALDLPITVLRPVFFMENLNSSDFHSALEKGTFPFALPPETKLQMISVDDIGGFAAMAFNNPKEWIGKAIELAGDNLTMPQVAEGFSQVLGKPIHFVQVPIEQVRAQSDDYATMLEWFIKAGYHGDIGALRELYPQLTSFGEWLDHNEWVQQHQPVGQANK
jgi:uncharacterized protein YbjT (DUF2867 family)